MKHFLQNKWIGIQLALRENVWSMCVCVYACSTYGVLGDCARVCGACVHVCV